MNKQDFYFDLPNDLIAQYPLENRTDSRLLTYSRSDGLIQHQIFRDLIHSLNPGDLLVMNDTRVIPARLYGRKQTGGQVELLIERRLADNRFLAHIKASKAPKSGMLIYIADQLDKQFVIEVIEKQTDLYLCQSLDNLDNLLNKKGHIPLPLYITRNDEILDKERYQTVYAKHKGSVAAPTAGLHFDENLLTALRSKGINIAYTTLHVGSGTFRPLRCEVITDHKMHSEWYSVSESVCDAVNKAKISGNRVIAVGTTALRSLESAAKSGKLEPYEGETDIFIYPGYKFLVCDGLITNFHLPESTLILLVSAFIGRQETLELYKTAINAKYRFFSYGDACFLY